MDEVRQAEVGPKTTGTYGVKIEKRNSNFSCYISSKSEDPVGYQATHRGSRARGHEHLPENRDGGSFHGFQKLPNLIPRPGIILRQAIRECLEPQVWVFVEVGLSICVVVEAFLDVFCVEECDFDVIKA